MSQNPNNKMAGTTQTGERSENKALILALSGIILSILLAALDQTIVGTAMPRIVEELQGFSLFSWVTTAYLLTSTATIPIAGKLGDMFGRKWLMLAAVVIFLLGSILSGAAPSMFWLVIFRGLQGIGSGALMSNAFAVIGDLFPSSAKRAKWQGFIAAAFGMASVFGPSLGGFITDNLNWRWVFYVNMPVGLVALLALIFTLPNKPGVGRRKIDWFGSAAIIGAVVSLLLALTWGGQKEPNGYPWLSPQIIGLFAGAIVLTGLFLFIERRAAEPILPLHLFKIPAIRSVGIISLTIGAVLLGTSLYIPLFVQVVLGQSASGSGAIMTPLSLAVVFANILTGQFIGRVGILRVPFFTGATVLMIGVGLLLTLNASSPLWEVVVFMIVVGAGMGMIMPTMTIAVQESVERKDLGVGTSTVQFFRSIGSTVGVALVGTSVINSYSSNLNGVAAVKALPAQLQEVLQEPQNLINAKVASALPAQIVEAVRVALADAIHSGFFITILIGVALVIGVLLMPSIIVKSSRRAKANATPNPENPSTAMAEKSLVEF
ncbi:MAG: MFS transporter [Chloroflexi bacterium]|nr:MFS transporter [Chloroflexota bacterium]